MCFERRDGKDACDEDRFARWDMAYGFAVVGGDVGPDCAYDYCAGDDIPGRRCSGVGDGVGKLASVHDGCESAGGCRVDGGDGGFGWVFEREPDG